MKNKFLFVKNIRSGIVLVTLNRPDKRNALNMELLEELCVTFEELRRSSDNRVVLLNGEGSVFCAGLDLNEAIESSIEEKSAHLLARFFTTLYTSPFVTIAVVHGAALAGGAGILSVCDLALAAKGTKIGFPEARRGLVAAQVAVFLCRQMTLRNVRELLLLGELIDSEQALRMGLVNRSVELQDLMTEAMKMAEQVLQCAPGAIKETKRLLENLEPSHFSDDLEIAMTFHQAARQSAEAKEGIAAFLEKRSPQWQQGSQSP